MFNRIIKTYLTVFLLFFVGYSFINWLLTTRTGWVRIESQYSNFWIPFTIIFIPVFFILRPVVKKWEISSKTKDGLLWALFPFSISIPTAFSQDYIKDANFDVISIQNPKEVHLFPNERFFKINKFYVNRNEFTLFKERHVRGGKSSSLKVNNYYIAPLYSTNESQATGVAYGLKFSTSLNNGLLYRDEQPKKIQEFNIKSASEFTLYDLDRVMYFERQVDSEDASNFIEAWKRNSLLNQQGVPVVLVGSNESFDNFLTRRKKIAIWSVLVGLSVTLSILWVIEFYRR